MIKEDSAVFSKQSVQQIYEILRKNDSNNNPMAGMMQRNLRLFEKMNVVCRKEIRRLLAEWKNSYPKDIDKMTQFVMEPRKIINRFITIGFDHP